MNIFNKPLILTLIFIVFSINSANFARIICYQNNGDRKLYSISVMGQKLYTMQTYKTKVPMGQDFLTIPKFNNINTPICFGLKIEDQSPIINYGQPIFKEDVYIWQDQQNNVFLWQNNCKSDPVRIGGEGDYELYIVKVGYKNGILLKPVRIQS